jgi:putative YhbY family RNA-binding protein
MNELTPTQRRALRATAHHLNPVVSIAGNGLTDAVLKEINVALKAHELIKVKLYGIERAERDELLAEICTRTGCAPVQHIGNILVLWLENPDRDRPVARNAPAGKKPTKKQAAAAAERPRRRQTARAR